MNQRAPHPPPPKKKSCKVAIEQNVQKQSTAWRISLQVCKPDVENPKTHQWVQSSGLTAKNESFYRAAQDRIVPTRTYRLINIKENIEPKLWQLSPCNCTHPF